MIKGTIEGNLRELGIKLYSTYKVGFLLQEMNTFPFVQGVYGGRNIRVILSDLVNLMEAFKENRIDL